MTISNQFWSIVTKHIPRRQMKFLILPSSYLFRCFWVILRIFLSRSHFSHGFPFVYMSHIFIPLRSISIRFIHRQPPSPAFPSISVQFPDPPSRRYRTGLCVFVVAMHFQDFQCRPAFSLQQLKLNREPSFDASFEQESIFGHLFLVPQEPPPRKKKPVPCPRPEGHWVRPYWGARKLSCRSRHRTIGLRWSILSWVIQKHA